MFKPVGFEGIRRRLLAIFACALFVYTTSAEDKKYNLSDLDDKVGDILDTQINYESKSGTMSFIANGELIGKGTASINHKMKQRTEIVAMKDGEITQYTTVLLESDETYESNIFGEITTESEKSPLLNQKVTWILVDDQYVPELPNATEEQLEELEPEPATSYSPYPADPIAIGHEWELDRKTIADFIDEEVDAEFEGKGSMKFVEIVEHQGQLFAKIKMKMSFSKDMDKEELDDDELKSGKMAISMEGFFYRSLDQRIDIDVELNGTMNLDLIAPTEELGDMTIKLEYEIKMLGGDKIVK